MKESGLRRRKPRTKLCNKLTLDQIIARVTTNSPTEVENWSHYSKSKVINQSPVRKKTIFNKELIVMKRIA